MIESYISAWKRAFDFKGRSNRKEYWQFTILNSIICLISIISSTFFLSLSNKGFSSINPSLISSAMSISLYTISLVGLLLFFGSIWIAIPLTVRRIRDVGMSWKWIFFVSLPYLGGIFIFIFLTRSSILSIDGKEYYLRYPTKKIHIQGYWIASLALIALFVGMVVISVIAKL